MVTVHLCTNGRIIQSIEIYILFCYNKMFSLSAATNIDILRVCRGLHITLPLLTILIRHNFLSEPGVYNIMTN